MELVKQAAPLEFVWKDITFLVRPTATAGDKFALTNSAPITSDGKQRWNMEQFWKRIIELFVTGWRGVTDDGKDVPFTMDALARLPVDPNDDVYVRLGEFITKQTGIIDQGADRKNASGQP